MAATTDPQRENAAGHAPENRCCSAEAAVMRWALSHIAARRMTSAEGMQQDEGTADTAR